jgi:hypothetical protein
MAKGATILSWRRHAMKEMVFQRPCGAYWTNRSTRGQQSPRTHLRPCDIKVWERTLSSTTMSPAVRTGYQHLFDIGQEWFVADNAIELAGPAIPKDFADTTPQDTHCRILEASGTANQNVTLFVKTQLPEEAP